MADAGKTLLEGRSSLVVELLAGALGFLLLGGVATLMLVFSDRSVYWLVASAVLAGMGLFLFVWQWLDWRKRWYLITDFGIEYRWGVITVNIVEVPFAWIWGVGLRRGLSQRMFGCGDVRLYTQNVSGGMPVTRRDLASVTLRSIRDYEKVRELIRRKLQAVASLPNKQPAPSADGQGRA